MNILQKRLKSGTPSQRLIAINTGVSRPTIAKMLTDPTKCNFVKVKAVCKYLNIDVEKVYVEQLRIHNVV